MNKFIAYFGLVMAFTYTVLGLYFLLGPYFNFSPVYFAYQSIFGGVLAGYGVFRFVRAINQVRYA